MPESKNNFKDKLTNTSTQPNTNFLNELRTKLPQFFTQEKLDEDGNIAEPAGFDMEKFKANLAQNNIKEIHDGYTLNYVGKTYARLQVGQPTPTVIIPDLKHNAEAENAQSKNVFLTGDNLDVLKHLRNAYTGAIDFIYIDPPYNTGSDGFVYNDKFDLKDEDLRGTLGFSDDDINRLHLLNGRSSHSAWLTFMYPRLKIAQQLLKDTGVIFVSIDDNEQADLKLLMDDVFGEGNFVADFIITRSEGGGLAKQAVIGHDYLFVYSRNINNFTPLGRPKDIRGEIVQLDNEDYWIETDWLRKEFGKYGTLHYEDIEEIKGADKKAEIDEGLLQNKYVLIEKDDYHIVGRYRKVSEDTSKFYTLMKFLNKDGVADLTKLGISELFSFPKPTALIKELVRGINKKDAVVLDFFAGSATTADAVMQLNAEDGGYRQYILATLDEEAKSEVAKTAGYQTIDEISRERIKRAVKKIKEGNPLTAETQDFGFKHFYVKDIDAQTVDKITDFGPNNLQLIADDMVAEFGKPFTTLAGNKITVSDVSANERGEQTILQTWLTDDGYKFDQEVARITLDQHFAYHIENRLYIISPIDQDDIKALLNLIGENKLNVATIIVFGYSLDFATMTSLKNNVKTALDNVKVEVRW